MFETNEKVTSPSKETEDKKKNHMEIFELKNLITEKKNKPSMEGFNIRMEEAEERINELEDRTIEITQSEHQKKKRLKKTEKQKPKQNKKPIVPGTCGTVTKELTFL